MTLTRRTALTAARGAPVAPACSVRQADSPGTKTTAAAPASVASGAATSAPAGPPVTVKVGYLHTIAVDDKLALGLADGHFKAHGIQIEATKFDTGVAASQALAGGHVDVAIMGGVTSNYHARGQGKIFMLNSVEKATAQLWVQPNSPIKTVADLKGKQVATTQGTTADIYLTTALKKAGLKRTDIEIVNAAMPNAVQAFVAGSVHAIALWVPFDLRIKESRPGSTMIDNAGNYPEVQIADGWIANNAWYEKNPDTIIKLIKGWLATNKAFRADPDGSLKKVHETWYAKDATLTDLQHQIKFQGDFTNEQWVAHYKSGAVVQWVGDVERIFVEIGGVPTYVDPKTFFDTSLFLKAAG